MVVLTTRFAVLGAFVYLASLSLTPLSVGAAAIHKPSLKGTRDFPLPMDLPFDASEPSAAGGGDATDSPEENQNQARSAAWPAQLKNTKRHHHHHHAYLIDVEILKAQAQHHLHARRAGIAISNEYGASYRVVPRANKRISGLATRRIQDGVLGRVDIMSPDSRKRDGEKIGSLALDKQVDNSADDGYTLYASEGSATPMYLVDAPSTSRAQSELPDNANVPVILQIPMDESPEPFCATYSTESSDQPLTAEKCEKMDGGKSQTFAYNEKTGVIQPEFDQGSRANSSDSSQGVLERADGATARNVTLVFVPDVPQVAGVEGVAVTSTSTTTTTVTVTGAATPALSAAGVDATSSAGASPTSTPALTSATDPSAPTAASAGRLDVQVVGPANSSTAMLTSAPSAAAAPTGTINAQDVAAGIAASSSQPGLATDAPAVAPTAAPFSSAVAPVTAAADSAPTSSGTTASVAPTMSPFSTEPYKWVFRRE